MSDRPETKAEQPPKVADSQFNRRDVLAIAGGAAVVATTALAYRATIGERESVFVARHQRYDGDLAKTIADGLQANGFYPAMFRGKQVLLKPNLVEPMRDRRHMTTHPAVVAAAAEVFRSWSADVVVGEAPGHVRDTDMALIESGMIDAISGSTIRFADLNYEDVGRRKNESRISKLDHIYFPKSVLESDYVVSMPKMKTHHWMGMTASMKNFYGVLPGIKYGWPKNVLHHAGIPQTVVDINACLPSTLAIVDGIECMEGDGPILGTAKQMGLLVVGGNLPATDATIARIMGLLPEKIPYLALAARLGPIHESQIRQVGEDWTTVADPFQMLDRPHLRHLRASEDGPLVS